MGLFGQSRRPTLPAPATPPAVPSYSTMSSKPASDTSTVPQYKPVPPTDWKSLNPFGQDQSYGTGMDMGLGQRLSGGKWGNY